MDILHPSQVHCPSLIPEGFEIAVIDGVPQDVEPSPSLDISLIDFQPTIQDRDEEDREKVTGELLRQRAIEIGANWGLADFYRMVGVASLHNKKIVDAVHAFSCSTGIGCSALLHRRILLPGTVVYSPQHGRKVAYLGWYGHTGHQSGYHSEVTVGFVSLWDSREWQQDHEAAWRRVRGFATEYLYAVMPKKLE